MSSETELLFSLRVAMETGGKCKGRLIIFCMKETKMEKSGKAE